MQKPAFYLVNAITLYRLLAAFFLIYLVISGQPDVFKWLLALSFFTDLIDGYLARKFKVTSIAGAMIDSIGDDLTIVAGMTGMYFFKYDFVYEERISLLLLFSLFILQIILSLIRYRKISSFHTLLAKVAAILQGSFMILLFLLPQPLYPLFYLAVLVTFLDLLEEIILVILLREWKANVKGLYWILKEEKKPAD
ncbi:MAG: CDP-alcohol phosphatidyltransferase family protein [Bacteroidia bacterium]|nr:CDP-alcohol phosphatidyltransferase family protein [Bacteroidia bacterium]